MIEIGPALQARLESAVASAGPLWDEEARGRAGALLEAMRASGGLEEAELTELMTLFLQRAEGRAPRDADAGPPEEKRPAGEERKRKDSVQPPQNQSYAQLINILDFLYRRQKKLRTEQNRKRKTMGR